MKSHFSAPLYEGTFSVGLDQKFIRIGRDDKPAKGALKISINPFLIHSGTSNILFDAGLGEFGEDTSCQVIVDNLAECGVEPFEITDIFLSHLHYDHMGGLAGKPNGYWELTFPDARLWVSRAGWQKNLDKNVYYDDQKTEFIHFLDAKANVCYYESNELPAEITTKTIGGHTEHHQALFFDDGQQKFLMAGDVLATRGHVNRKFAAKYDYDAKQSIKVRNRLVRKAYKEEYTIMGYHDNHHPLFTLSDYNEQKGYTIEIKEPAHA